MLRGILTIESKTCIEELSKKIQSRIDKTTLHFWLSIVILLAFGLAPIFCTNIDEITKAGWFQRAGALIVAVFVVVEFRLYRHLSRFERLLTNCEHLHKAGEPLNNNDVLHYSENLLTTTKMPRYSFHTGGLIGTVIWGYGDMFWFLFLGV